MRTIHAKGMISLATVQSDPCAYPSLPRCPAPAMAYVPWQCLDGTYSPELALTRGTLFPELDKPFQGHTMKGGARHG